MVRQLTLSKTSFIKNQVLSRIDLSNLLIHLKAECLSCSYHCELIRRVWDSVLDKKYDKDRIQLHELFVKGASSQYPVSKNTGVSWLWIILMKILVLGRYISKRLYAKNMSVCME